MNDRRQQATDKLSPQAKADAKKKLDAAKQQADARVPSFMLEGGYMARKPLGSVVSSANGKIQGARDAAAKAQKEARDALSRNPSTRDIFANGRSTLTGKDRERLARVANDSQASPKLRQAARDALRQDGNMKKTINGAITCHPPGTGRPPLLPRPGLDPFHCRGHHIEPFDFGGLFGGIAAIISVAASGGGGGGGDMLPEQFADQGCAVFQPCEPVEGGVLTAENIGGLSGVYYSIDDPVAEDDEGEVVTQADNDLAYAEQVSASPTTSAFQTRYLLIGNSSSEKITVYLQYLTLDPDGNWVWPGGDGDTPGRIVPYELEPGQSGYASDGEWQIHAARVRVWAESESGRVWETHRDADFVLVTETDDDGNPAYVAVEMGTAKWVAK